MLVNFAFGSEEGGQLWRAGQGFLCTPSMWGKRAAVLYILQIRKRTCTEDTVCAILSCFRLWPCSWALELLVLQKLAHLENQGPQLENITLLPLPRKHTVVYIQGLHAVGCYTNLTGLRRHSFSNTKNDKPSCLPKASVRKLSLPVMTTGFTTLCRLEVWLEARRAISKNGCQHLNQLLQGLFL